MEGAAPVHITQRSGEQYGLAELLRQWQIPAEFCEGISERWRCEIVPAAINEEVRVLQHPPPTCPTWHMLKFKPLACAAGIYQMNTVMNLH